MKTRVNMATVEVGTHLRGAREEDASERRPYLSGPTDNGGGMP